ncbi:hypothetical protein HDV05_003732 [Chytridiales sp. JEL 0842]|nr:hypothetical protein HDV05_003732 [Chytridiales sp. JEL 0842]
MTPDTSTASGVSAMIPSIPAAASIQPLALLHVTDPSQTPSSPTETSTAASTSRMVSRCLASFPRSIISHVPSREQLLNKLSQGKPFITRNFSALSMVDISGYSSLTSRLVSIVDMKASSEIITKTVGSYMDQVVTVISSFKGDVVKFLGDAILVSFPQLPEESESDTVERATFCCLYIMKNLPSISIDLEKTIQNHFRLDDNQNVVGYQSAVVSRKKTARNDAIGALLNESCGSDNSSSSSAHITLSIHTALTAGLVDNIILGPHFGLYKKRSEESESIPGHLLSSASDVTAALPREYLNVEPKLDHQEISEENYRIIRLFVNESLLNKIESGSHFATTTSPYHSPLGRSRTDLSGPASSSSFQSIRGEFREISVVFIKLLSPFSADKAQKAMEGFVDAINKWKGVVQQFAVDDKGQSMLGCFGLPPWTHEKDALHALKCCLEFKSFVKSNPTLGDVSISVATGDILFSAIGNFQRMDASILGDAVNVAARLLSVGLPNQILCDERTYTLTRSDCSHTHLGLQTLKGKVQPVPVWSVHEKGGGETTNTMTVEGQHEATAGAHFYMVGYTKEREILEASIQDWQRGLGKERIVIQGKSGSGKSKLIDWMSVKLSQSGIQVSLTQGSEIKMFTPYFALQNLMHFIFKRFLVSPDNKLNDGADMTWSLAPASNGYTTSRSIFKECVSLRSSVVVAAAESHKPDVANKSSSSVSKASLGTQSHVYNENANCINDNSDYCLKVATHFLISFGESTSLAPLLTDVLPFLLIKDSSVTKTMDAQTKRVLLKSMIVRIVNKSLEREKFAIVLDDMQWFDQISLDIFDNIMQKCHNAPVFIFMRPLEPNAFPIFTQLLETPHIRKLEISGLTETSCQELLVNKFESFGVTRIADHTLSVIFKKCEGSPLLIDSFAESVKLDFSSIFSISSGGELSFCSDEAEQRLEGLASMSGNVIRQLDRLAPQIQLLLKRASILGQYFLLEDLADIFYEESITADDLQKIIETQDTAQFLLPHTSDAHNSRGYFWRHIQIMSVISNSQSYSERASEHLQAAEYFENLLFDDNLRQHFLPLVVYHYKKTDKVKKQLKFTEELSLYINFQKGHMLEASKGLADLLQLAEEHSILDDVSQDRKALWLAHLVTARVALAQITPEELSLCLDALKKLGRPWPDEADFPKVVKRSALQMLHLWITTKGGTRPPLTIQNLFTKKRGYSAVVRPEDSPYRKESYGISWTLPGLSKLFFKHAIKIEAGMTEEERRALHKGYQLKTLIHILHGQLSSALDCIKKYISYAETRGDVLSVAMGQNYHQMILTQQADIRSEESGFIELFNQKGIYQWPIMKFQLTKRMMVVDRKSAQDLFNLMLLTMKDYFHRDLDDSCVEGPLAWFAFQDGDFTAVVDHVEKMTTSLSKLRHAYYTCFDVILTLPLLACFLASGVCVSIKETQKADKGKTDVRSWTIHKWTPAQVKRICASFTQLEEMMSFFAIKNKMGLFYWPLQIVVACRLVMEQDRHKATQHLLKELNGRKTAKLRRLLDTELHFARGIAHAFLSLFSKSDSECKMHLKCAQDVFRPNGIAE